MSVETKKRILLVDDETDFVSIMERHLQNNGYEVASAVNGQEALARVKDALPDVIITDVVMPEMDGFTFYKELKRDGTTAEIPVIVMTGRAKMADSFVVLGVDDFLVKPFEAKALLDKLENLSFKPKASKPPVTLTKTAPVTATNWKQYLGIVFIGAFFLLVVLGGAFLVYYVTVNSSQKDIPGESQDVLGDLKKK